MKQIRTIGWLVLVGVLLTLGGTGSVDATFTAQIDCSFVSWGRGYCEAWPQGSGYSYSWYASGAGVADLNYPAVSASCGGPYAYISVQVSHSSGGSSSDSTSATCPP